MLRVSRQAAGTARGATIPAPTAGWNARDALADMKPGYAVALVNYFPRGNSVDLRRGFDVHATGLPSTPETLMEWSGATRKLFAAAGSGIYDVSSAGAVGAAVVSGLTNARWQHTMFQTAGGNFLVACNGADAVRNYDGTTWTTPSITGVSGADLIDVTAWKSRLWFVEDGTSFAWYLPTNSIAGAASSVNLGAQFRLGGTLRSIVSLSQDTADGPDDYLAFVSSKGEVVIYEGTDPASANTFAMVGRYRIGAPIGQRCVIKIGGDAGVITEEGVQSLLAMLRFDRGAAARATITDIIRNAFNDVVREYRGDFGWQGITYPEGQWALFNVPVTAGTEQYVMNTASGAWCRFTGMDAACWGLYGDDLYFGSGTSVYLADSGYDDGGAAIEGQGKTAFDYLGSRGLLKRVTMLRAIMVSNGVPAPKIEVNVDYEDRVPTATPTFDTQAALWDVALWDGATWGSGTAVAKSWTAVSGLGRCAAVHWTTSTTTLSISVTAFDLLFEPSTGAAL